MRCDPTEDVVFSLEIRDEDGNTVMRTDTTIIGIQINLRVAPA